MAALPLAVGDSLAVAGATEPMLIDRLRGSELLLVLDNCEHLGDAVADLAESLLNSTFDHNGRKAAMPFATEADMQGLLTMLFSTWLSGGNPPLFMDFRKVGNRGKFRVWPRSWA